MENDKNYFTVKDLLDFINCCVASGELDENAPVILPNDEFLDFYTLKPANKCGELDGKVSVFDSKEYITELEDNIKRLEKKIPSEVGELRIKDSKERIERYRTYDGGLVIGEI